MAKGTMSFEQVAITNPVEILNRPVFEGVPMTLDFSSVDDEADNGEKVIKAGTPIDDDGVPAATTPWTGAVGILLYDVYESRPQGTLLKKAYINETVAQEHAGVTYDATLKGMFPMIVFESGN